MELMVLMIGKYILNSNLFIMSCYRRYKNSIYNNESNYDNFFC